MLELTADEARVLGALIEKALTTPENYPLTLNALVNGCNQKNNREPVTDLDDLEVLSAVNGLKAHGLVVQVDQAGARTSKYRHQAEQVLGIGKASLALLAELLLRGPQTLGELRGRASRMHPFESLEGVKGVLETLLQRDEPLIRPIAPAPGSRAERYVQLLAPDAHDLAAGDEPAGEPATGGGAAVAAPALRERVERLEGEVARLRSALQRLAAALGEADPLAPNEETHASGVGSSDAAERT